METPLFEIVAVLFGFLIRLGIPIGLTLLLSLYLKWLDGRWQAEAEAEEAAKATQATELLAYTKPCWELHNCPPKMRNACRAYAQPQTPCWETFRIKGKLKSACATCKVFPPALA